MAVSKAIVPLLRGEAAKSFKRTLASSCIKPYSASERQATEKAVREILGAKERKCQNGTKKE